VLEPVTMAFLPSSLASPVYMGQQTILNRHELPRNCRNLAYIYQCVAIDPPNNFLRRLHSLWPTRRHSTFSESNNARRRRETRTREADNYCAGWPGLSHPSIRIVAGMMIGKAKPMYRNTFASL
jgi:hypothetical protein